MKPSILVVDDEPAIREFMNRALRANYSVHLAPDASAALDILRSTPDVRLMLSDIRMPGMDGIALLKAAKELNPALPCIMLTAFGSIDQAVEAMKKGADDFLTKPIDLDALDMRIAKALENASLKTENASLRSQLNDRFGVENIVGSSPAMEPVFRRIRQVAPTEATVLIEGPSGTGKELVARAIHNLSNRSKGPFVAVECAALNENLLESELFGHERGAFTGADKERIGRFEAASGGTLFLDEISEITPSTQVKLLRALETRSIERIGSSKNIPVDIRLVAACNRKLASLVAEGKFREDLFYRLNVVDVSLPALRDRTGDVPMLANRFLKEFSAANGNRVREISPEALKLLENWSWPGNVRELRNTIEKMVVLATSPVLGPDDVPEHMRAAPPSLTLRPDATLGDAEKAQILAALERAGGNCSAAAKALGIARRTLYRKLEKYSIR